MRLFLALDLPEPDRDALVSYQRKLASQRGLEGVRWVRPSNLHLTLKFIGERPADFVAGLIAALPAALGEIRAIETTFARVAFIPARRPNVIAIEPDEAIWPAFEPLASAIEQFCGEHGVTPEQRAFRPHVTIGRCGKARPRARPQDLPPPPARALRLDQVTVYESELRAEGPTYRSLGHISLVAPDAATKSP